MDVILTFLREMKVNIPTVGKKPKGYSIKNEVSQREQTLFFYKWKGAVGV
jgi:hypothetical protein